MSAVAAERSPMLSPSLKVVVTCAFLLSGLSGLIYQSVWSHYLGLILGHAAYAQALVLAIFMGGMALGAWLVARMVQRFRSPLLAYGIAELAIGVFGLMFHAIFLAVQGWLYDSWLPGTSSAAVSSGLRWSTAVLLILPQSVLLGTTFPLMSAALIRVAPNLSGPILGNLYFLNSIGAAAGAIASTFLLVPEHGLPGTMRIAGIINAVVGGACILTGLRYRQAAGAQTSGVDGPFLRIALVAAALTGASSFMYELGWVRMLSLVLGSSLHAFEIMLAAFIGGLAFGGLYVKRRLHERADAFALVGVVQVLMGASALLTLIAYQFAFDWLSWFLSGVARTPSGYSMYNLFSALVAGAIMVPAAFFAGMTLPGLTFALLRSGSGENVIGRVYAANTLGAIAGVFLTIHLLLPVLGLKMTMVIAGSIDIVLGLWLLQFQVAQPGFRRLVVCAVLGLGTMILALNFAAFDPRRLVSGVYRTGMATVNSEAEVLFYRDGKTATVSLTGNDAYRSIATNGKPDAAISMLRNSRTPDERTMVIAGLLSYAFKPELKTVGIIGFGSGLTTHTIASGAGLESVETIEIEPAMVEAARGFGLVVGNAFADPRSHIVYDDARAYFAAHQRKYDVIISEPSNPWVNGVAKLFTQEFYQFIPRHLNPHGLMVQWVHTYELNDETLISILKALDAQFSDYRIFAAHGSDMLIVATPEGELPPISDAMFADPGLKMMANYIYLNTVEDFRLREIGGRKQLKALLSTSQVPTNSDFFPYVSHRAPQDRFLTQSADSLVDLAIGSASMYRLLGSDPLVGLDWSRVTPDALNVLSDRRIKARQSADEMAAGQSAVPNDLSMLRLMAKDCFAEVTNDVAVSSLVEIHRTQASAADAEQMRALWGGEQFLGCAPEALPDMVHDAAQILRRVYDPSVPRVDLESMVYKHQMRRVREELMLLTLYGDLRDGDPAAIAASFRKIEPQLDALEQRYLRGVMAYAGHPVDRLPAAP